LRFGNEQTARCSLILLARWTCPLIPLMSSLFDIPDKHKGFLNNK
jgi:hypothetical protein